jgi:hypothetical protein
MHTCSEQKQIAKQCKFNEMDKLDKSTTEEHIHLNRKKWIKLVMMLEKVK